MLPVQNANHQSSIRGAEVEYPSNRCVHELFEAQAAKTPDAVAVIFDGRQLTYGELNSRSNQLAHHLRELGVRPNMLVAICVERSLEMVIGLIGILKAGGAYVPLDLDYPAQRLAYMLEDSAAPVLLTQSHLLARLPQSRAHVVCLDTHWREVSRFQSINPTNVNQSGDLAYCIYTSGSTGKPKGVELLHSNAVAFLEWVAGTFHAEQTARIVASTSICFDLSIFELFGALRTGGTALLIRNALALPEMSAALQPTLINTVPSAVTALLGAESIWPSLRVINLAGEALSRRAVNQLHEAIPAAAVFNLYGPSEYTTYSTAGLVAVDPSALVTIGRPIWNTTIHILDEKLNLVPRGTPGEIHVTGAGLARGYLNRADLTAERFIPDPFGDPGSRMYRTGDLGRYLPDGSIEYLGRVDHQVKIRGYRIELGEVESALNAHEDVREAVVVAREYGPGDKRLVGYVVAKEPGRLTFDVLQAHLQRSLPQYMVPSVWTFLTALPLTPNGKVDRNALPDPNTCGGGTDTKSATPRSPIETTLAAIWAEVTKVESVGVNDRFSSLAGTSIQAVEVSFRVSQMLGRGRRMPLPLGNVTLANYAAEVLKAIGKADSDIVPTSSNSGHANDDTCASYAQQQICFLEQLGDAWRAYRFHARFAISGRLDRFVLEQALNALVARHESLRTSFVERDGRLERLVAPELVIDLPWIDLSKLHEPERSRTYEACLDVELGHRFDVSRAPLIRWLLIRMSDEDHVLVQSEHHNVHDGQSFRISARDLAEFYSALIARRPAELPAIGAQYGEFCREERQWLGSIGFQRQLEAWAGELAGLADDFRLFPHVNPPNEQRFVGGQVRGKVTAPLLRRVDKAAAKLGISRFAFMMSAFGVLCSKIWLRERFLIGSALANRTSPRYQWTMGMFVNMLPIPFVAPADFTFGDFARSVSRSVDFSLSNSGVPLGEIVKRLGMSSRLRGDAPFNVAFSFHDSMVLAPAFADLRVKVDEAVANGSSKFDLNVIGLLRNETAPDPIELMFEYNSDVFERQAVERMVGNYLALLESLVARPESQLKSFSLPIEAERSQALTIGRNALPQPDADPCLDQAHAGDCMSSDVESAELGAILEILNDILPGARLQATDDLFARGMHSLLLMRFVSQCRQRLNVRLLVRDVYRLTTPAAIADFAKSKGAAMPQ